MFKNATLVNIPQEYATEKLSSEAISVTKAVHIILEGVSKNKAIIIFPLSMRIAWYVYRFSPDLMESVWIKRMRSLRKYRISE